MESDVWLTPPDIILALGDFDLDPCSPEARPWDTAARHYSKADDGLIQPWVGRVWLNPPYNREVDQWLDKMSRHGDGIALIFARTETKSFFEFVWRSPTVFGALFIEGRLHFHHPDGSRAKHNSGAPSVLVGYGKENGEILRICGIAGYFVPINS